MNTGTSDPAAEARPDIAEGERLAEISVAAPANGGY